MLYRKKGCLDPLPNFQVTLFCEEVKTEMIVVWDLEKCLLKPLGKNEKTAIDCLIDFYFSFVMTKNLLVRWEKVWRL